LSLKARLFNLYSKLNDSDYNYVIHTAPIKDEMEAAPPSFQKVGFLILWHSLSTREGPGKGGQKEGGEFLGYWKCNEEKSGH
jgi:hypothetical protein